MQHYDDIIIGFGKGGKTLAGYLASQKRKVALIEMDKTMYGGTCINVGCIPSKSLVTSALTNSKLPGFAQQDYSSLASSYAAAIAEKRRVTGMLRQKNYAKLADHPLITVVDGTASFLTNTTIKVQTATGSKEEYEAERFFINTGSTPVVPPIKGLQDNPYVYDSRSLMDLDRLPQHLVIVGGGYIGLEFASMYATFGSKVTILQDGPTFIPREDRDLAAAIQQVLEAKGVTINVSVAISQITAETDRARVHFTLNGQAETLTADAVLVATGRRPNTEALNLQAAGVDTTPRGAITTDAHLKTSAPNIWAMGDVVGGLQFTYISLDDFRIVKSQLSGDGSYNLTTRTHVPYSVFIDPPFSRVGITEAEALAQGRHIKVATLPAAAIPKAQVLRHPVGLLKAIIDADTKKILGAMLLCEESHELINNIKLAMDLNADYTILRDQIFTHPTMSEALNDLFNI